MLDPREALSGIKLRDGNLRLELENFEIHEAHKVPTFFFRMLSEFSGEEVGSISLRVGSTAHVERYAGHIGYSVHERHRGQRFAARSVVLLKPLAERLGLDPLWITTDPGNMASQRSLELAGATFVETVDVPEDCGLRRFRGKMQKCRYRLPTR
ncbi:MAG TPA: GNAT family N-acetyltransferase [Terracidiphilus sp.]|jgi:predicted acetyltransferase|nr:GNAT family N-acetyltransferase [Terracidiphilus sp.]